MTQSIDYEFAQILLELKIPRFGFPVTRGYKKRSVIAVAATTSTESPLSSSPKATKTTTSETSLSFSSDTDHSDPDYNPIRKRTTAKKISLKREKKNVNINVDLEKDSNLNLKGPKQELSVGESEDDIVSPIGNQMDGPTEIPDLNIPYEPNGSDSIEGLDVNAAMANEESK